MTPIMRRNLMSAIKTWIQKASHAAVLAWLGLAIGGASLGRAADAKLDPRWQAQWIGPGRAETNTWICYRKTFVIDSVPASVVARVAVDSKYWMWINGKLVVFEGGLKRGPAPKDGYYDELNLTPHLAPGTNAIAVLVWFWGKDGFAHQNSGQPGLVLEAKLGGKLLKTDRTWKMRIHPAYENALGPAPNYRLAEASVRFDARKEMAGWTAPGFDVSSWTTPVEWGTPPVAPWNRLARRPIPLWKDSGLIEYVNGAALPAQSDGKVIAAQLPYNAHVTPYFKIEAPAGLAVDLRTDNYLGGGEPNVHGEYITRAGVQEYESLGWMNGHEVHYTFPAGVKILALRYRETGYDAEFAGAFSCDDPFFNTLWEKSQRTLYVTMRDNYMDCPDRERAQWWGDAVNELGEVFYVFDPPAYRLTRKAILELAHWQREDHTLYSPVPAGQPADGARQDQRNGAWNSELPQQMLASVGKYGFWTYYFYTGDKETLREVYPQVREYLKVWTLDAGGLVVHRPGDWDWADWGQNIDAPILDSAWYHLALQGAVEMARLGGYVKDVAEWRSRMKSIEKGFNARFWNGKEYRSPGYQGDTDDRGNGLAVVARLAGPDKYEALRAVFRRHQNASPYLEKYVLEALFLMGDDQAGLDRIKQRYDGMVRRPISTLAELMDGGGTYNHAWSGGPLTILSQYVAGVAPEKAAYEQYHVLPQMGSLRFIKTVVPTVKGNIDLLLARGATDFALKLDSPNQTVAWVGIPTRKGQAVQQVEVNGQIVWTTASSASAVKGVEFKRQTPRHYLFTAAPGTWAFKATYGPANQTAP